MKCDNFTAVPENDVVATPQGMSCTVVRATDLSSKQLSTWSQIQQENRFLDSPFFRPEFTLAVASHCNDVEVAVISRDGCEVGFLPFHRDPGNIVRPVGRSLSDFHGVVAQAGADFSPAEMLRQCGLKAFHFSHLLASQTVFTPHHWMTTTSPFMNLSRGFEHYQDQRRKAGSEIIKQALRRTRRIERDFGPLRFVAHEYSDERFQTLIDWKIAQYRRIRSVNHLADPWRIDTLRRIARERGELFSGMLSSLYVGDRLIAIHLGMLSGGVLHCWFPAYATELAKYSPGLILWLRLAQEAEALGVHRMDLGKGNERFKTSLGSDATLVAEGSVDLRPVVKSVRHGLLQTREWIHSSVLCGPVQGVVRGVRRWTAYRSL